jgi:heme A synthase
MKQRRFATYAWSVLAYNILVILWGAYVRATGAGAGCGRHWPLCNGQIVPRSPQIETIIEYAHRTTGALAGVFVVILLVWAWRAYPRGHAVRRGSVVSLIFIVVEGLLGAGLVRFEWVAGNASTGRVMAMAVHLVNSFILLGALSLTAWWATTLDPQETHWPLRRRGKTRDGWLLGVALSSVLIVSATGAVTALGDTLFPANSLAEGLARDFSATAHFLERLRVWHPLLAVVSAIYIFTALGLLPERHSAPRVRRLTRLVQLLVAAQIAGGLVNLILLAPIAMQLVHLLLADGVWISLVLLSAVVLEEPQEARQRKPAPIGRTAPSAGTD